MSKIDNCPSCNANLIGDPIPEDMVDNYAGTHWRREIALYCMERDRTISYQCPDCAAKWDRFTGELIDEKN